MTKQPKRGPGRPPSGGRKRTKYVHVPCSTEWHAWLAAEAERLNQPMADLVAEATEFWIIKIGGEKPPRR
jgi:hypothetical protein